MMSTGRMCVEAMCSAQRARSALKPAQRLWSDISMPEEVGELAVEVEDAALRVVDGADDDIAHAAQAGGEHAQRDGLAGAGITGVECESAVCEREFDASAEGVDGGE